MICKHVSPAAIKWEAVFPNLQKKHESIWSKNTIKYLCTEALDLYIGRVCYMSPVNITKKGGQNHHLKPLMVIFTTLKRDGFNLANPRFKVSMFHQAIIIQLRREMPPSYQSALHEPNKESEHLRVKARWAILSFWSKFRSNSLSFLNWSKVTKRTVYIYLPFCLRKWKEKNPFVSHQKNLHPKFGFEKIPRDRLICRSFSQLCAAGSNKAKRQK